MILDKINDDLKAAMRAKDENSLGALRMLKSDIKNAEIEKKAELLDEEVLKVIAKRVKQVKDSIDSFKTGGREDLVAHEEAQLAVLAAFLPQQMPEAEVRVIVKAVIAETSATQKDFGAKGATDGSMVSKIAKEELVGK
jgi:uncharacterized protein YqeY